MSNPNESAPEKRGRGRPPEYREEFCDRVIDLGAQGKSPCQIATTLGFCRNTLDNWAAKYPEFAEAYAYAKELCQAWFEDCGQAGLFQQGFNAQLWNKQVSARFREEYTERRQNEHTGPNGAPVAIVERVIVRAQNPDG